MRETQKLNEFWKICHCYKETFWEACPGWDKPLSKGRGYGSAYVVHLVILSDMWFMWFGWFYWSMRKEDTYFWRVPKCSVFKDSSGKLSESLELFPRRSGGIVDSISACIGI